MRPNRRSIGQAISLRALLGDERGAVAAYVAIISVVMIGVGALAVDLGRLYTLDTELQAIADAAAMACARELDQEADSITRGTAAAQQGALVANEQTFVDGGSMPAIVKVRFFDELPPDTMQLTDPATDVLPYATTDGTLAHYCETTVETTTLKNTLIRIIPGAPDSADLFAMAVAGVESAVCNTPGLMICNPAEGGTTPPGTFPFIPGQQVLAKAREGSQGGQWAPGDFGLLEMPGQCFSTQCIRDKFAQVNLLDTACFNSTVNIRPGQATAMKRGFNVRHDIYDPPMHKPGIKGNENYRPGKHVGKGSISADPCNVVPAPPPPPGDLPQAMGFPQDGGISGDDRFGNGIWNFADYWEVNHPGLAYAGPAANPATGVPTRYQVYRYEIDNNWIPSGMDPPPPQPPTAEDADSGDGSSCFNDPNLPGGTCLDPLDCPGEEWLDRRILVVAIIDCQTEGIAGAAVDVNVTEWIKVFSTEPIPDGGDVDIWLEIIAKLDPGVDDFVKEEIVLYR